MIQAFSLFENNGDWNSWLPTSVVKFDYSNNCKNSYSTSFFLKLRTGKIETNNDFISDSPETASPQDSVINNSGGEGGGGKGQRPLEGGAAPKPHRQSSRIIEPLPGPSHVEWKKRSEPVEMGSRKSTYLSQRPSASSGKGYSGSGKKGSMKSESGKSDHPRGDFHRNPGSSNYGKTSETTILDRYGRPMPVKDETIRVLKQLPDISFLSARTLLYNPEQKQIVQDLGAMINRKMPGWVTSVWMRVWKAITEDNSVHYSCYERFKLVFVSRWGERERKKERDEGVKKWEREW